MEFKPEGLVEMDSIDSPLAWSTYNYKADRDVTITECLSPAMMEERLFEMAATGKGDYVIMDHVGPDTHAKKGVFIARIIAAGSDRQAVKVALEKGVKEVDRTVV